jgi:hypothetical protein
MRLLFFIVCIIGSFISFYFYKNGKKSSKIFFWTKILREITPKIAPKFNLNKSLISLDLPNHPLLNGLKEDHFQKQKQPLLEAKESNEEMAYLQLETTLRRIEKLLFTSPKVQAGQSLKTTIINQKAFWDSFRDQTQAVVMLYHLETCKVVFVSSSVKRLFGFSAADFKLHFHDFLYDLEAWKRPLRQLKVRQRLYAPLAFKIETVNGPQGIHAWDAYMAELHRTNKAHFVVVLFYPAYCKLNS